MAPGGQKQMQQQGALEGIGLCVGARQPLLQGGQASRCNTIETFIRARRLWDLRHRRQAFPLQPSKFPIDLAFCGTPVDMVNVLVE